MRVDVAIIGGTGTGEHLLQMEGFPLHIPTPVGLLRGRLVDSNGIRILVLNRHSAGHKVPPHRVNYAAMAHALRQVQAKACFSTAAVGCLRREWPAGTLVACSDFWDLTYRNLTLHHRTVEHCDFSDPFGPKGRRAILDAANELGYPIQPDGVYVAENGPRYETPQEIRVIRQLGGDLVGMTASTEAILMREAGIDYSCLAIVTNLAAGISETPLSHEEVVDEMKRSGPKAVKILLRAAEKVA